MPCECVIETILNPDGIEPEQNNYKVKQTDWKYHCRNVMIVTTNTYACVAYIMQTYAPMASIESVTVQRAAVMEGYSL